MNYQSGLLNKLNREIVSCNICSRLVSWREDVSRIKRKAYMGDTYWGKPVPGFGDIFGELCIVGLAPGAHGANRTGRLFTGDKSGDFLFKHLFNHGFANQKISDSADDGLSLINTYITSVCRCVPPRNRPSRLEIYNCLPYLFMEICMMKNLKVIVALGKIAFSGVIRTLNWMGYNVSDRQFAHGYSIKLSNGIVVVASYHPSQYNTSTRRLTDEMFNNFWGKIHQLVIKTG